jgi:hypothetical protein
MVPVQQAHFPAPEPFACRRGIIVDHAGSGPQLLHEVVEIHKAVQVITEPGDEALLQQIPHLRSAVAEQFNLQIRPLAAERRHIGHQAVA